MHCSGNKLNQNGKGEERKCGRREWMKKNGRGWKDLMVIKDNLKILKRT